MELRHLEYFVAVAEEQNFTRASQRLHIVQSAVSAAVKSLERELGTPLLERGARQVTLTDAGAEFLPHARTTLDAARDARDAVARVRGGLSGPLRIGVLTSIRIVDVPAILGEFHRRHPGVQLYTRASTTGTLGLIEMLAERRLDLAFVTPSGLATPGVRLIELARSVLDLALPAGHPLASRTSVTMADLAGLDFIDSPAGYGNRAAADRAFAAAGLRRQVTIEITELAFGPDYVRNGLGVALFPRFAVEGAPGIVRVPVEDADLEFPVSLAVPEGRTPSAAARALIAQITG
ncbi:LysR family transcriptional regulator [Kineosporia succinea]|uniref:DNA-binding transcriptional LysR family regulator n=1 Tax=Kineosporia succinea TaxID=84632 RepID=A0ABT9NZN9_9ACTN|nr:LysR family transcriptional regulator [Kineosporia succinea]MDP9825722.1 DNA-binding transcriptional LysR family regulator [Kineosporia succinea]